MDSAAGGLIIPSKVYGIAAAGLTITAETGENAPLVEQYKGGMVVEPGNIDGLTPALVQLASDVQGTAAMGRRARTMLEARFTRRHAFERWRDVFDHIG